jgi:hypothetical protein
MMGGTGCGSSHFSFQARFGERPAGAQPVNSLKAGGKLTRSGFCTRMEKIKG